MVEPIPKPPKRAKGRASPTKVAHFLCDKNWTCEICGDRRDLQIHHIKPRSRGGTDDPDNWLLVCGWRCHKWIHEHPEEAKRAGWLR